MLIITAYPLTWLPTKKRTPLYGRIDSSYRIGFAKARDELLAELQKLNAYDAVISSNIELRQDGLPYANFKEPTDSGICLYFRLKTHWKPTEDSSYAICCDSWIKAKDNLRAIGEYLSAWRTIRNCRVELVKDFLSEHQIERYKLERPKKESKSRSTTSSKNSQKKQQTSGSSSKKTNKNNSSSNKENSTNRKSSQTAQKNILNDWQKILNVSANATWDEIKSAWRKLVKLYHPDSNGGLETEKIRSINRAYEQAKEAYQVKSE